MKFLNTSTLFVVYVSFYSKFGNIIFSTFQKVGKELNSEIKIFFKIKLFIHLCIIYKNSAK